MPGSVTVSRRSVFSATRLADRVATTPLANVSHASASSASPLLDRRAARRHRGDRRAGEREHVVDIVDHHVEDHVDVGGAARPWRAANGRDAARVGHARAHLPDHRREALDVAHLENDPGIFGGANQSLRGRTIGRDRLLDEHVDTGLDEVADDGGVAAGRHGDRDRIDRADECAMVGVGRTVEVRGRLAGAGGVHIGDADKPRTRVRGEMAGVVAPEDAEADNAHADQTVTQ